MLRIFLFFVLFFVQVASAVSIKLDGTQHLLSGRDCSVASYRFGTESSYNGEDLDLLLEITEADNDYRNGPCVFIGDNVVSFNIKDTDFYNDYAYMNAKFTIVKKGTFIPVVVDELTVTNFDLDSNPSSTDSDDVYYSNPSQTLISKDSDVVKSSGTFFSKYNVKLRGKDNGNCNDSATLTELSCRGAAIWNNTSNILTRIQNDDAYGNYANFPSYRRLIQFSFEYDDIAPLLDQKDCGEISYSTNNDEWISGTDASEYSDNLDISKLITMNSATQLSITVEGETEEGYDWIAVYDEDNNLLYQDDGNLDSTPFTVDGSSVIIKLHSDGSVSRDGATITIRGLGCTEELSTATCYALPDNSSTLYKVTMSPNASSLPIPSTISLTQTFNGEGTAYRASNHTLYTFKEIGNTVKMYGIDLSTYSETSIKNNLFTGTVEGAEFYYDPMVKKELLYILSKEYDSKLYAFDPDDWSLISGYPKNTNTDLSSLAVDPVTGQGYAINDYDYHGVKPNFYTINLKTGATTLLTHLEEIADAESLAFASDGNLYLEDERGDSPLSGRKIYKVDLQTGALTPAAILGGSDDVEGLSCNGTRLAMNNPTIRVDDNSSIEGDSGARSLFFHVQLSKEYVHEISFDYEIIDGNSSNRDLNAYANSDYTPRSAHVTLLNGERDYAIAIPILGDNVAEENENFSIKITNVIGAIIEKDSAIGTIINDDAKPKIYISDSEVIEGNDGTDLEFTVVLDKVAGREISFSYELFDGNNSLESRNALAPSDYTKSLTATTVPLEGNVQTFTIKVPIIGDTEVEDNETFTVVLSNLVGVDAGNLVAKGTIVNDDEAREDLDQDNDGILDTVEYGSCESGVSTLMSFDDFGQGGRTSSPFTTYCYEDGTGSSACTNYPDSIHVNDGEYAIVQHPNPDASAFSTWSTQGDHTGNSNGRMMVVNASLEPDEFYRRTYTVIPHANMTIDLWILNVVKSGSNIILPNISFKLENMNGEQVGEIVNTGNIPENGIWNHYTLSINPENNSQIQVVLANNAPGGSGNDLALDDIRITQVFCDSDNDGIANYLDLDSDNDGIPDNIEAQTTQDYVKPNKIFTDDGVDTAYVNGLTPVDTDGDGIQDYIDLDSDEDGIFDIQEAGLGNNDTDNDGRTNANVGSNGLDNSLSHEEADNYSDVNAKAYENDIFNLSDSDNDTLDNGSNAIPMDKDFDYRDSSNSIPTINVTNVSVLEGNSSTTNLEFTVTLNKVATLDDVTFDYQILDGNNSEAKFNAISPSDYASVHNVVPVVINGVSKQYRISIPIVGDTEFEEDEQFRIVLSNIHGATRGQLTAIGTIVNDDSPTESVAEYRFDECMWDGVENEVENSKSNSNHGVARNGAKTVSDAQIQRAGEFNSADEQYVEIDGFDDVFGKTSNEFTVTAWINPQTLSNAKTNHKTKNTFFAKASDPKNDNIEIGVNPDGTLHLYLDTTSKDTYADFGVAGDISPKSWNFVAISYKNGKVTVQINENVYTNTTKWNGATFIDQAVGSPVTIGASLHINNYFDGSIDEVKIFDKAVLSSGISTIYTNEKAKKNADGTSRAEVTCVDIPLLSINSVSQVEGDSGTDDFTFTVTLDHTVPFDVTFTYATNDGTAMISDNDYVAVSNTITILAGESSISFPIQVRGDTKQEGDETFYVYLSNAINATIPEGTRAVGTIEDNDQLRLTIERVTSNSVANGTQIEKESLYTQITAKDFDYSIVAYDKQNHPYTIENMIVKVELLDFNTTNENNLLYRHYAMIEEGNNRFNIINSDDLKVAIATRNARFRVSYLVDENNTIIHGYNTYDVTKGLGNNREINFGSDNFAIRPAGYKVTIQDSAEFNNTVYRTNSFSGNTAINLAAGYEYELKVEALMNGIGENVVTQYKTITAKELNATLIYKGKVSCADTNDSMLSEEGNFDYSFNNGKLIAAKISHDNVGKYEFHIEDINWTNEDQDERNLGCILNSYTNIPDATGKIGCKISSNSNNGYKDISIDFKPYAFNITNMIFSNANHDGRDYLYTNNLNDSTEMGVEIKNTIIAEGKDGNQLSNFTRSCEASNVEMSLDFTPTFRSNYTNTNGKVEIKTSQGTSVYPQQIVKINGRDGNVTYFKNINVSSLDFLDENEGNTTLEVCYNMEKHVNEATNPIRVNFVAFDVNSTHTKAMMEGLEKSIEKKVGSGDINATRTFYYARIRSDRRNYPETYKKVVHTALTVEVYCKVPNHREWCTNTMNLGIIGLNGRKTDGGWYIDRNHNSALDGNVTALDINNSDFAYNSTIIPAFKNGRIDNLYIRYTKDIPDGTTKTRVDIITQPWLRYSKYNLNGTSSFFIKVKSESSITGVGDTNTTNNITKRAEPNGKIDW